MQGIASEAYIYPARRMWPSSKPSYTSSESTFLGELNTSGPESLLFSPGNLGLKHSSLTEDTSYAYHQSKSWKLLRTRLSNSASYQGRFGSRSTRSSSATSSLTMARKVSSVGISRSDRSPITRRYLTAKVNYGCINGKCDVLLTCCTLIYRHCNSPHLQGDL